MRPSFVNFGRFLFCGTDASVPSSDSNPCTVLSSGPSLAGEPTVALLALHGDRPGRR